MQISVIDDGMMMLTCEAQYTGWQANRKLLPRDDIASHIAYSTSVSPSMISLCISYLSLKFAYDL